MEMTCKQFLYGSLKDLGEEMEKRITSALHDSSSAVEVISEVFEEIMIDIEKQNGMDSFTGHGVAIKFALLINKKENKDAAISFLNKKLERMGQDEFHTLITMAEIYDKNAEYREAFQTLERAKKVVSEEDELKFAVLMLKLSAHYWNHKSKCTEAYKYQKQGMYLLKKLHTQYLELKTPSSQTGIMFIDAYNTAAYVYRIQNNHYKSSEYYEKAYDIVKKCPNSKLYHLKGLSQVCVSKSNIKMYYNEPVLVAHLIDEAIELGDEFAADDEFMKAHVDTITHIYSKLAHANDVLKDRKRGLTIRLKCLEWLTQYQGKDHPEVARVSAGIAFTYYLVRDRDECDKYVHLAEDILSSCEYKEDILRAKLYFREISDTLHNLGNLFSMMNKFVNAEECYKRSLNLHIKVYGENHQRMSKIFRFIGNLYSRWGKKDLAVEWLTKAMDVSKLYLPASQSVIDKIKTDLEKATTPQNPRMRANRGRRSH